MNKNFTKGKALALAYITFLAITITTFIGDMCITNNNVTDYKAMAITKTVEPTTPISKLIVKLIAVYYAADTNVQTFIIAMGITVGLVAVFLLGLSVIELEIFDDDRDFSDILNTDYNTPYYMGYPIGRAINRSSKFLCEIMPNEYSFYKTAESEPEPKLVESGNITDYSKLITKLDSYKYTIETPAVLNKLTELKKHIVDMQKIIQYEKLSRLQLYVTKLLEAVDVYDKTIDNAGNRSKYKEYSDNLCKSIDSVIEVINIEIANYLKAQAMDIQSSTDALELKISCDGYKDDFILNLQ